MWQLIGLFVERHQRVRLDHWQPQAPRAPKAPNSGRFAAVRECLQKNGITLPQRTPGQRRPPGAAGGFLGGGARWTSTAEGRDARAV